MGKREVKLLGNSQRIKGQNAELYIFPPSIAKALSLPWQRGGQGKPAIKDVVCFPFLLPTFIYQLLINWFFFLLIQCKV